jgi:bacillithiol system protein YtxJ
VGLRHDSPQAILLLQGAAVWHAEHLAIEAREITRQLAVCCA